MAAPALRPLSPYHALPKSPARRHSVPHPPPQVPTLPEPVRLPPLSPRARAASFVDRTALRANHRLECWRVVRRRACIRPCPWAVPPDRSRWPQRPCLLPLHLAPSTAINRCICSCLSEFIFVALHLQALMLALPSLTPHDLLAPRKFDALNISLLLLVSIGDPLIDQKCEFWADAVVDARSSRRQRPRPWPRAAPAAPPWPLWPFHLLRPSRGPSRTSDGDGRALER